MNSDDRKPANPLDYEESFDQATEFLRLALPVLAKFKLPPNPLNYTLCYEYVSGRNPDLAESMDTLLKSGQDVRAEVMQELYQRFIRDGSMPVLENIRSELRRVMAETLSGMGEAVGQANHSNATMVDCSEKLAGITNMQDARQILDLIVSETAEFTRNNTLFKDMLIQSQQEVESLRKALQQSRHEAMTDALTGLLNRRAFDKEVAAAIDANAQTENGLSLLIADIDHFKRFNDTYGHLIGDKVIQFVASQLAANVKGKDTVARFGGEEFAVILPTTRLENATRLAETIRQTIETSRLKRVDTGKALEPVTVSIGVACFKPGEPAGDFVQRADHALYTAKSKGRNQVSMLD